MDPDADYTQSWGDHFVDYSGDDDGLVIYDTAMRSPAKRGGRVFDRAGAQHVRPNRRPPPAQYPTGGPGGWGATPWDWNDSAGAYSAGVYSAGAYPADAFKGSRGKRHAGHASHFTSGGCSGCGGSSGGCGLGGGCASGCGGAGGYGPHFGAGFAHPRDLPREMPPYGVDYSTGRYSADTYGDSSDRLMGDEFGGGSSYGEKSNAPYVPYSAYVRGTRGELAPPPPRTVAGYDPRDTTSPCDSCTAHAARYGVPDWCSRCAGSPEPADAFTGSRDRFGGRVWESPDALRSQNAIYRASWNPRPEPWPVGYDKNRAGCATYEGLPGCARGPAVATGGCAGGTAGGLSDGFRSGGLSDGFRSGGGARADADADANTNAHADPQAAAREWMLKAVLCILVIAVAAACFAKVRQMRPAGTFAGDQPSGREYIAEPGVVA